MLVLEQKKRTNASIILAIIVTFVSNDTLLFGTNANRTFFWLHIGILLASAIYMLFHVQYIGKNALVYALFMIAAMMLTQGVNLDSQYMKYAYNAIIVVICVLFSSYVRKEIFYKVFVSAVYIIALFAIIAFLLQTMAPSVVSLFPIVTNKIGNEFGFYGLGIVQLSNLGSIPRAYGFFREPGVFAVFLVLSLIIQLFFLKQFKVRHVVVTAITAILTFSTAAYIVVPLVLTSYFIKQIFETKNRHRRVWILALVLLFAVVFVFFSIGPERIFSLVFNKLSVDNSSRDSRFGAIPANFNIFLQNPVFGKGWDYVEKNFAYFASLGTYAGAHNTNTMFKFLAIYGIGPFICIACAIFAFFRKSCKSVLWALALTLVWFVILSNEDMTVNVVFYLLPFYAFEKEEKRREPTLENIIN